MTNPETITEITAANAQFSTPVSALSRVGLDATLNAAGTFMVNLGTDVIITNVNGGTAKVVLTDVQATNGVIHVLDTVLLP